jgi:hypothetical protein
VALVRLELSCAWCTRQEHFHGEEADDEAREAGWFTLLTPDDELDFCGLDCMVAHL